MEILLEALLQIAGWALQVAAEILLQLFGELVLEAFLRSLSAPFERAHAAPPWMAAIGYLTYGALAGAASLWPVPAHFIATPWLRAANLLVAPVCAGLLMGWLGAWRRRHGQRTIRLDSFAYGFCFAFGMAAVRLAWGR